MKKRTREEAAAYKRELRARKRVPPCPTPPINIVPPKPISVPPPEKCPTHVPPVCKGCEDRDTANKILRGRVAMLEKELGEMRKLLPEKGVRPYKGF